MESQIYGAPNLLSLTFLALLALTASALPDNPLPKPSAQINSNSVLVALLDSRYTELSELVEKALLLQTLEDAVANHNISIFATRNEALERDLDPEFKRFLLELGNLKSFQNLLLFHMIPTRIHSTHWPLGPNNRPVYHTSLCRDAGDDKILLHERNGTKIVGARIRAPVLFLKVREFAHQCYFCRCANSRTSVISEGARIRAPVFDLFAGLMIYTFNSSMKFLLVGLVLWLQLSLFPCRIRTTFVQRAMSAEFCTFALELSLVLGPCRTNIYINPPVAPPLGGYGYSYGVPYYGGFGWSPFSFFAPAPTVAVGVGGGFDPFLLFIALGAFTAVFRRFFGSRRDDDDDY